LRGTARPSVAATSATADGRMLLRLGLLRLACSASWAWGRSARVDFKVVPCWTRGWKPWGHELLQRVELTRNRPGDPRTAGGGLSARSCSGSSCGGADIGTGVPTSGFLLPCRGSKCWSACPTLVVGGCCCFVSMVAVLVRLDLRSFVNRSVPAAGSRTSSVRRVAAACSPVAGNLAVLRRAWLLPGRGQPLPSPLLAVS
jgi:hypothetical protein